MDQAHPGERGEGGGGGAVYIYGWWCAAATPIPLPYTRPRSTIYCNPILD